MTVITFDGQVLQPRSVEITADDINCVRFAAKQFLVTALEFRSWTGAHHFKEEKELAELMEKYNVDCACKADRIAFIEAFLPLI
jgi:hypothetical protein